MRPAIIASILMSLLSLGGSLLAADKPLVLLEAEAFQETGGWVVDQQFMDQMGSPFLLAHGLGEPVRDATTTVTLPEAGTYQVWVRTRDWVAPWKAPGAPGRFQVLVNGQALGPVFGTEGEAWHWQSGGTVEVPAAQATVALHDLTGFEGRCDAILFSRDPAFVPPSAGPENASFRRRCLGVPEVPEEGGSYDLVVVGGGFGGVAAAVSAARQGLTVALVQDRPVLGGNGSSEVKVWPEGWIQQKPYPHVGDVVAEMLRLENGQPNSIKGNTPVADRRKLELVQAEPNITLFLDQRVNAAEVANGTIKAVVAQQVRTAKRLRLAGRWFVDSTGDGALGTLAGADSETTREGHMGPSNIWKTQDTQQPSPFPHCPWAVDLSDKPFPGRGDAVGQWSNGKGLGSLGCWFWENGFSRDPIGEAERIRDQNFRAMYGAWDTLKNVDKLYPNHKLGWAAYVAGKRESRRLLGDVVLSADDFRQGKVFDDGCFPCSWHIDLHYPEPAFQKGHEGDEFISRATTGKEYSYKPPYWAPYRCLYSRNIGNLFMAGRDISVTHEALGPVRVMRTIGMMGEVVGMAAALCKEHGTTPRGVFQEHLGELKAKMRQGVGKAKPVAEIAGEADIYLLAGQSNMEGHGQIRGLAAGQLVPPARVFFWDGTAFEPLVPGKTKTSNAPGEFGPELGFAAAIAKVRPDRAICLVKFAIGGQSLHPGWNDQKWLGAPLAPSRRTFYPGQQADDPNVGAHYLAMRNQAVQALAALEAAKVPYRIRGILWMQGEQDSKNEVSAREYPAMLRLLKARLEQDLKTPGLPLVYGQVLPYSPALPRFTHREEIRRQMQAADARSGKHEAIPGARMVPTDGFPLNDDHVHYNAAGQWRLGQDFAAAMLELQKVPPAP